MISYIILIILITIIFCIWTEYSVGGISIRPNSFGYNQFHMSGLVTYLVHPLFHTELWNYKLLDVNYIFVISSSICLYYLYDKYVKNKD